MLETELHKCYWTKTQSHTLCFQDSRSSQSPPVLGPGCTSNETQRSPDTIPKQTLCLDSGHWQVQCWAQGSLNGLMKMNHMLWPSPDLMPNETPKGDFGVKQHSPPPSRKTSQKKRVSFGRMLIILPVEFSQLWQVDQHLTKTLNVDVILICHALVQYIHKLGSLLHESKLLVRG